MVFSENVRVTWSMVPLVSISWYTPETSTGAAESAKDWADMSETRFPEASSSEEAVRASLS